MIDSNNQFKKLSNDLINSVRDVMETTKEGGTPKTDKHKDLAAKAPPYDKITHADVLVGRGVLKKHPTTGKLVTKEEAEAIDELSEPTVRNYYNKAGEQGKKIADKMKIGGGDWTADGSDTKTLRKRAAGRDMALKRRRGEIKMSEEIDQIDELSRKTLGSYVKRAAVSAANQAHVYGVKQTEKEMTTPAPRGWVHKDIKKLHTKADRRLDNIAKAADKLTREGSGLDLARTVLNNIRNELAEGIDEAAFDAQSKAHDAHFKKQPQAVQTRLNAHLINGLSYPEAVAKVKKSVDLRNKIQPMKEDVESIDEALDAAARYGQHHVAIKDLLKSIDQHVRSHKDDALKHKDYRGKKGVNWGHVGDLAQVHSQLADIHDRLAQQGEYKKSMSESVDEEVDQIDELSKKTLGSYIKKAGKQATSARGYEIHANSIKQFDAGRREMKHRWKREKGIEKAVDKMTGESVDEAYDAAAADRYRKAFGPGGTVERKRAAMNWLGPKDTNDEAKARTPEQHKKRYQEYIDLAKKGKTEGNRTLHSLATNAAASYKTFHDMTEDVDQIDELSKKTLGSYIKKAGGTSLDSAAHHMYQAGNNKPNVSDRSAYKGSYVDKLQQASNKSWKKGIKRARGVEMAADKMMKEKHELDEARGRPRKNPLPPGKKADPDEVEARMHIIQQLERAKLSMRGGEPVTFMDGTKHTVHSPDANKIIMKYHSMKPFEKEVFQKKIHASHAGLKAEL